MTHAWDCSCGVCQRDREIWAAAQPPLIEELDPDDDEDEDEDLTGEPDDYNDSMDGDHESGLASAGWGTDEDYGDFGGGGEDW